MKLSKWIQQRPSIDIALTLYRRVKPHDRKNHPVTQPIPTYTWVVKRCGKHPSTDKYWTGRHITTAKTSDNLSVQVDQIQLQTKEEEIQLLWNVIRQINKSKGSPVNLSQLESMIMGKENIP